MKIGTAHTPLDSGAVSGFGGAFAGKTAARTGGGIGGMECPWILAFAE